MFLTAEFADKQSVAAAITALQARGFSSDALDVFSAEPVAFPKGLLDRPSRMSLVSVLSAAVFGVLAILFVRFTQHNYRIVTGGMPIFSWLSSGVIFYEFMMFGGISAVFVMFLVESGPLKRGRSVPAPVIEPGRIYLRVRCDAVQGGSAIECLGQSGAIKVEKAENPI
jgi:hypothetical protein